MVMRPPLKTAAGQYPYRPANRSTRVRQQSILYNTTATSLLAALSGLPKFHYFYIGGGLDVSAGFS